jgi:hypothetical protein
MIVAIAVQRDAVAVAGRRKDGTIEHYAWPGMTPERRTAYFGCVVSWIKRGHSPSAGGVELAHAPGQAKPAAEVHALLLQRMGLFAGSVAAVTEAALAAVPEADWQHTALTEAELGAVRVLLAAEAMEAM